MLKGFFVTGTDTEVGKTVVAATLIRAMQAAGFRTCGMKPVETGCERVGNVFLPSDGMILKEVARMQEQITDITAYCFENPLAPLVAAQKERVTIEPEKIKQRYTMIAPQYEASIVEGIGGIMVPITEDYYVLDMAKDIGLPLIIVTRPSLGTINHTLLTVRQAQSAGLSIAGLIINFSRPPEETEAEKTNPKALSSLTGLPIIATLPYLEDLDASDIDKTAYLRVNMEVLMPYL